MYVAQKNLSASVFLKKLPIVNNDPIGENSHNLVTLLSTKVVAALKTRLPQNVMTAGLEPATMRQF
jgi:hypothetical protein